MTIKKNILKQNRVLMTEGIKFRKEISIMRGRRRLWRAVRKNAESENKTERK